MKIKVLLAAAVMLVASAAKSQNIEIENLKTQISRHPEQDTFRVNRLNQVGLNDDLPANEKEKAANEALLISRKIKYTLGAGYALLNLGDANTQMGKKQQADAFLKQADSIAKKRATRSLLLLC